MNNPGSIICRERLRRNWSQEGLCRGICTVSYLSKIESGKAEPSEEILSMLFCRLGIDWRAEMESEAETLADRACEALFSAEYEDLSRILDEGAAETYGITSCGAELELLIRISEGVRQPLPAETEKCLQSRGLALQRILQGRAEEAILLLPNAYVYYEAGAAAYSQGNYVRATEHLQNGYEFAAGDGSAKLMLLCKLFLGSCCCNRRDISGMERHYIAARRLAKALGDSEAMEQMAYNSAATAIECGEYEKSYAYFSKLVHPDMMSLHKLAICCEKTGRTEEALSALDRAETMESAYPDTELARLLCAVVRYRVENPGYLKHEKYGEMLLSAFERCRSELSMGYANFHLPWVLEWYKASRQYKKALELMESFPAYQT